MSKDAIIEAIEKRNIIEIVYSGETRRAEPHLLGVSKSGVLTLSAWQLTGKSGIGWRAYVVEKIGSIRITDEKFSSTRPGYNPDDSTMSQIVFRY